jgi:hypothetical protein
VTGVAGEKPVGLGFNGSGENRDVIVMIHQFRGVKEFSVCGVWDALGF